jgi:hypothetical protein
MNLVDRGQRTGKRQNSAGKLISNREKVKIMSVKFEPRVNSVATLGDNGKECKLPFGGTETVRSSGSR